MSFDCDVLVIGGGGGGLVAAIAARAGGAEVMLAEKTPNLGGNTALSSGSVPGAGTRFQRDAGIEDSPERFAADIRRQTEGTAPETIVRALTEESPSLVEWLVDDVRVPLELEPKLLKVGHSVPRTHRPPGRQGNILLEVLEKAAEARGITIARGNAAVGLLEGGGGVVGARLKAGDNASEDTIRARKVILACNGFGGNPEMVRQYCPEAAEAPYFGHQGNTGEGIRWGMDLGAATCNMMAYQGHASVAYPHGSLLSWTIQETGGFLVNNRTERFVDEMLGYSGCAAPVLAQPDAAAYAIFDKRIHDYMAKLPDFIGLMEVGGVKSGTIREVADALRLDADRLEQVLAAYNAAAAGKGPDALGRTKFGNAPLVGPYSGVRVTGGLFHTQGGLLVDAQARVLRADGMPIANLYAAGGTAVGVSGSDGGRGYCSANGLLAALGLGRIAGRDAANSL